MNENLPHIITIKQHAKMLFEKDYDPNDLNVVLMYILEPAMKQYFPVDGNSVITIEKKVGLTEVVASLAFNIMDQIVIEKKKRIEKYEKLAIEEYQKDQQSGISR